MDALLVAHDPDEAAVLSLVLQRAGLAVLPATDLERALRTWSEQPADLVVVAPGGEVLLSRARQVRAHTDTPLVVVANPLAEDLHVELLNAGVDLVVLRPYSARLLIAQVRGLLRRAAGVPAFSLPTLTLAGLALDPATRTVRTQDGPPTRLTHLEFRLLYTLMMHPDQVIPTETLVESVWGYSGRGDRSLVRGLVRRLRTKIEPVPEMPSYVVTVSGVGYFFNRQA